MFKWSFIYEKEIHAPYVKDVKFNPNYQKFVERYIEKLNKKWQPLSDKILKFMEKISNLKWKVKIIPCYVIKISSMGPISDPLTIPIMLKTGKRTFTLTYDDFIDILVHELIHNLFIQNEKSNKYFEYLVKKYKGENWNTIVHIPIHAIHKEIYLYFFNRKRLEREKQICKRYKDYKRAWEIVEKEGSKKIIEELRNIVK
jgi:hypothetical protein